MFLKNYYIVLLVNHHHWLDSPAWALAFLRSFCHLSFSIATFLQFFTPKVLIGLLISYNISAALVHVEWGGGIVNAGLGKVRRDMIINFNLHYLEGLKKIKEKSVSYLLLKPEPKIIPVVMNASQPYFRKRQISSGRRCNKTDLRFFYF
jgi:hypothetical protein